MASTDPSGLTVSNRSSDLVHQHSESAQPVVRTSAISDSDVPRIARRACNVETDALERCARPARMKWRRDEYQTLPSLAPCERSNANRLVAGTRDRARKNHLRLTRKGDETLLIGRRADPSSGRFPQLAGEHNARGATRLPELEAFQQTIHSLLRKHSIRRDTSREHHYGIGGRREWI